MCACVFCVVGMNSDTDHGGGGATSSTVPAPRQESNTDEGKAAAPAGTRSGTDVVVEPTGATSEVQADNDAVTDAPGQAPDTTVGTDTPADGDKPAPNPTASTDSAASPSKPAQVEPSPAPQDDAGNKGSDDTQSDGHDLQQRSCCQVVRACCVAIKSSDSPERNCVTVLGMFAKACVGAVGFVTDILVITAYFGGGHVAWGVLSLVFLVLAMMVEAGSAANLVPATACSKVKCASPGRLKFGGFLLGCCALGTPVGLVLHMLGCATVGDGRTVVPLCAPKRRFKPCPSAWCCRRAKSAPVLPLSVVNDVPAGDGGSQAGGAPERTQNGEPDASPAPDPGITREELAMMVATLRAEMPEFLVHRALQEAAQQPGGLARLKTACDAARAHLLARQRDVLVRFIVAFKSTVSSVACDTPQLLLQFYVLLLAWAGTQSDVSFDSDEMRSQVLAILLGVVLIGLSNGSLRTEALSAFPNVATLIPTTVFSNGSRHGAPKVPTVAGAAAKALAVLELVTRLGCLGMVGLARGWLLLVVLAAELLIKVGVNCVVFMAPPGVAGKDPRWVRNVVLFWIFTPGNVLGSLAVNRSSSALWACLGVTALATAAHIVIAVTDPLGVGGVGGSGVAGVCSLGFDATLWDCAGPANRQFHVGLIVAAATVWLVTYGCWCALFACHPRTITVCCCKRPRRGQQARRSGCGPYRCACTCRPAVCRRICCRCCGGE